MTGPVEGAVDVTKTAVSALTSTPTLLALVIMQVLVFAAITWAVTEARKDYSDQIKLLISQCGPKQTTAEEGPINSDLH